jgi:RNA 2',3'-cyclic 3'-phosphodiesterase
MISNDSPAAAKRKLFFALWPDPATRAALAQLLPLVPGRPIPPAKLHLTLAFLGQQEETRLPALLAILARLAVPAMQLRIDCFGYFVRPHIAWAGMAQPPAALLDMQAQLMAELTAAGFDPATHGAFKPHITLAREAKHAPPDTPFAPVLWNVSQVALVESVMATGEYLPVALAP